MKGKVQCTCGWSWNKSDSSKKDMYICHECGRDNSNNMKNGGWLDNYGTQENYNDYKVSAPEGMVGDGFSNVGRNYSPAWGGQFQEGGIIPMAQTGMATRADSLAVYNSAKAIEDYYKKQGYIKQKIKDTKKHKDAEKFAKSWINNAQKFLNDAKKQPLIPGLVTQASKNKKIAELKGYLNSAQKSLSKTRDEVNPKKYIQNLNESKKSFEKKLKDVGTYVDEQGNFIEGKPSAEKFYSPIDENKFYQREQSHGFLDLRSPMPLYDERITPQDLSQYRSPNLIKKDELENLLQKTTNKKEKESIQKQIDNLINTDNVELYEYDPLAVMPFDMIPPEQQEERVRKYGISGVPKSVLDLHPEWLSSVAKTDAVSIQDSAQVSRPNLETANITPAGMNLELSPNLNIIQQARTPKYFKVTDRVNQSFGGTETNYEVYPDQDFPSMSTQTYPDGTPMNTRTITPVYQQGGKVKKPIYVDSPNDPRYRAYQDSLKIYNYGNKLKKILKDSNSPGEFKEVLEKLGTKDIYDDINNVGKNEVSKAFNDLEKLNNKRVLNIGEYSKKFSLFGLNTGTGKVPLYKKPTQPVIKKSKQVTKNNKSFLNEDEYNKKYPPIYLTDPNDPRIGFYSEKGNKYLYKKPTQPVEVKPIEKRPVYEPIQITPEGYAATETELKANLNITPQARIPEYFNVTDKVNQPFGGTETNYRWYPDQPLPASMSEQTYEDGTPMNTRIITPVYQQGGSIPGSVGFTYARTKGIPSEGPYAKKTMPSAQNGQEMRFYQEGLDFKPKTISREGSVIKDDLGQWTHPGEITEIDSPYITMKGVPYPVLGISDTGDVQIMYPEEEYEFDGEKVTEYPMAKNGLRQEQKGLVNLDNLLNFTNYNTKQPGGWLDTL